MSHDHEWWQRLIIHLAESSGGFPVPLLPGVARAMRRALTHSETSAVVLAAWRLADARKVSLRRGWIRNQSGSRTEALMLRQADAAPTPFEDRVPDYGRVQTRARPARSLAS